MKIISRFIDRRIGATNILVETTTAEYLDFAKEITKKNEFQRKRPNDAGAIYSLLKDDLRKGCVIPPIVLAYIDSKPTDYANLTNDYILQHITGNLNGLLILDGLQRTKTMIDVKNEFKRNNEDSSDEFDKIQLRLEICLGIKRPGILYRMLTLNSGQHPMSLRHQIEILYSDYIKCPPDGITLIKQIHGTTAQNIGEYSFQDVIDGFHSYIDRKPSPIDRKIVIENIISLRYLSKENQSHDLCDEYLQTFHQFVSTMNSLGENWNYNENEFKRITNESLTGNPFGKDIRSIFSKSIVMTGFGSAIGTLVDNKDIPQGFEQVKHIINKLEFRESPESGLINLLLVLDKIKKRAKKIGNGQRMFFYYFFRALFSERSDSYQCIDESIENGYNTYKNPGE
ncbi:MAG: hypothetical protein GY862_07100 [Gammaproteobacteria bacterium]|nr:hypothetical protein [Gammaproteobacteria bacterium]